MSLMDYFKKSDRIRSSSGLYIPKIEAVSMTIITLKNSDKSFSIEFDKLFQNSVFAERLK